MLIKFIWVKTECIPYSILTISTQLLAVHFYFLSVLCSVNQVCAYCTVILLLNGSQSQAREQRSLPENELCGWIVTVLMKESKLGLSYCIILGGSLIKGEWVISNFNIILVKIYPTNNWVLIVTMWGIWPVLSKTGMSEGRTQGLVRKKESSLEPWMKNAITKSFGSNIRYCGTLLPSFPQCHSIDLGVV